MYLTGATLPPRDTQYVRDSYLGFESLTGRETLLGPRVRVGPFSIGLFFLLTAVGLVSLSLAAGYLFLDPLSRCRSGAGARTRGYTSLSPGDQAGLCGLTLLGLLVVQPFPFDRYLIPIIPVVAMCLLSRMPRRPTLLRSPTAMGAPCRLCRPLTGGNTRLSRTGPNPVAGGRLPSRVRCRGSRHQSGL
jgi:hypothetical protein